MPTDVGSFADGRMRAPPVAKIALLHQPDPGEIDLEDRDDAVGDRLEFPLQGARRQQLLTQASQLRHPLLHPPACGDVGDNAVAGHEAAFRVASRHHRTVHPAQGTVLVHDPVLERSEDLPAGAGPRMLHHGGPVLRGHHVEPQPRRRGIVLRRVAGDRLASRTVRGRDGPPVLNPNRIDVVGHRLEQMPVPLLARAERFLRLSPARISALPLRQTLPQHGQLVGRGRRRCVRAFHLNQACSTCLNHIRTRRTTGI